MLTMFCVNLNKIHGYGWLLRLFPYCNPDSNQLGVLVLQNKIIDFIFFVSVL